MGTLYGEHYKNFRERCCFCGESRPVRDLVKLSARLGYGCPKIFAYCCEDCTSRIVDFVGRPMPDLRERRPRSVQRRCPSCLEFLQSSETVCPHCGFMLD